MSVIIHFDYEDDLIVNLMKMLKEYQLDDYYFDDEYSYDGTGYEECLCIINTNDTNEVRKYAEKYGLRIYASNDMKKYDGDDGYTGMWTRLTDAILDKKLLVSDIRHTNTIKKCIEDAIYGMSEAEGNTRGDDDELAKRYLKEYKFLEKFYKKYRKVNNLCK